MKISVVVIMMMLIMSMIMKYRSTSDQSMVLQMWWRWSLVCSSVAGNQLATTLSMHHIIDPLLGHLMSPIITIMVATTIIIIVVVIIITSVRYIINPLLGHLTSHTIHIHSVKPAVILNFLLPTQCI